MPVDGGVSHVFEMKTVMGRVLTDKHRLLLVRPTDQRSKPTPWLQKTQVSQIEYPENMQRWDQRFVILI